MINGPIQYDITIVNIYVHNIGAPEYIRQILSDLKGKVEGNAIIVSRGLQ